MKHILVIPLIYGMEDSLVWHFDLKGSFSLHTMFYQIEKNFQEEDRGESSTNPNTSWLSNGVRSRILNAHQR